LIDRSFVTGIGRDQNDMAITSAIMGMAAQGLNLKVMAEGSGNCRAGELPEVYRRHLGIGLPVRDAHCGGGIFAIAVNVTQADCLMQEMRKRKRAAAMQPFLEFGSPTWTRTRDLRINSPSLYRLSYRGREARL
jgi:hypothetical protein